MQERQLIHATIGLANNRDMSGMGTADEISRSYRTGKGRSLWCIASFFLGILTVAGFFAALAPLPARADNNEDNKGIRAEIAALKAQVADLQNQVNSLQTSNTTLQSQLATVQSNHALLLGPFVNVDPNPEIGVIGPNIIFSGANIHIVSGSGSTDDHGNATGLGNLIIGYDEDPGLTPGGSPLKPGDRGGSHNLEIGSANRFTNLAFGGLVVGALNTISNRSTSVSGGASNTASGTQASVSGGAGNTATGTQSSVTGGGVNSARGTQASVTGGGANVAIGDNASISGGNFNQASGFLSSISGGVGNLTKDVGNPGSGGSSISGGQGNTTVGLDSSILGGLNNTANGNYSVILGGTGVTDNNPNSIAPPPPFP